MAMLVNNVLSSHPTALSETIGNLRRPVSETDRATYQAAHLVLDQASARSSSSDSESDLMPARFLSDRVRFPEEEPVGGSILQEFSRSSTISCDYLEAHGPHSLESSFVRRALAEGRQELKRLEQNPQTGLAEYDALLKNVRVLSQALKDIRDPLCKHSETIERNIAKAIYKASHDKRFVLT